MKPLLVGSRDYYTACLFRLEETRGHILNEQEYSELRKETLDELTEKTRKPAFAVASGSIALLGFFAAGASLLSEKAHPALLPVLGLISAAMGIFALHMVRDSKRIRTPEERMEMLESLREHSLVTEVEFSTICEKLKAA
jgi:hypothetical protein